MSYSVISDDAFNMTLCWFPGKKTQRESRIWVAKFHPEQETSKEPIAGCDTPKKDTTANTACKSNGKNGTKDINKLNKMLRMSAHKMSIFYTKEVKSKFSNKILSQVDVEPTYEHIHAIMMEIYANAAAVPTILGGGAHGHIGLVMDTALYTTLSTTLYVTPAQQARAALSCRATVVDQETMENKDKLEKAVYDNHTTVEEADTWGVTSRDIIDHIHAQYGKITSSDLKSNSKREALRVWKAKAAASKACNNFKTFFADEYCVFKEEGQLTAKEAGFHQANVMQDVSLALDNLANAAMEDSNIAAQLVDSNTKLSGTNNQLAEQAKTCKTITPSYMT
eukprot:15365673-Ditylum_brightwellii.AAC.4